MMQVTVDCHNGGKVTFQFSYAAGNNNGTSVEDGQIPEIIFYTWASLWLYGSYNWQGTDMIKCSSQGVKSLYLKMPVFLPMFPSDINSISLCMSTSAVWCQPMSEIKIFFMKIIKDVLDKNTELFVFIDMLWVNYPVPSMFNMFPINIPVKALHMSTLAVDYANWFVVVVVIMEVDWICRWLRRETRCEKWIWTKRWTPTSPTSPTLPSLHTSTTSPTLWK